MSDHWLHVPHIWPAALHLEDTPDEDKAMAPVLLLLVLLPLVPLLCPST
jgi:hypothetical protein